MPVGIKIRESEVELEEGRRLCTTAMATGGVACGKTKISRALLRAAQRSCVGLSSCVNGQGQARLQLKVLYTHFGR